MPPLPVKPLDPRADFDTLLRELAEEFGPSGCEGRVAEKIREFAGEYADEVFSDRLGSVIAVLRRRIDPEKYDALREPVSGNAPDCGRLALFAHMDEAGFMLRQPDGDGYLHPAALSAKEPMVLNGEDVWVGNEERLTAADCGIVCEPERFVLGEGNPVTLVYGGREATVYFRYAREIPTGLSVVPPDILAFSLGEAVDLSALKVYIVYNSGRREETTDYALSAVDSRQIGAQTVTVTCGEFSNVFTIYIQEFYRLGDVSGDGKITAYDARLVLRAAVGYIHYTGRLLRAADADRDGKLTASDARLVLRAAVGLENVSEEADI